MRRSSLCTGENAYNISVAVAGFAGADLSIEVKENTLTIRGNKQSSGEEEIALDRVAYVAFARSLKRTAEGKQHRKKVAKSRK